MSRLPPTQLRNLCIAVGLGLAAASLAGASGGEPARLAGGSLASAAVPASVSTTAGGPLAARKTNKASAGATRGSRSTTGDAALAGELDLDRRVLVDGRYEVPLGKGRRAVLTLDPELQAAAEKVLARAKAPRGAVVVTATDGRVLAYAGRRTTSPTGGKDGILDASLASTVWAPAASIFKIASAAALVDAGVDPDAEVCYHGGLRSVTEANLVDHRSDNRCNDLAYGLAHSQNAIIAKLANRHLDPDRLTAMGELLGFSGAMPAWALGGQRGEVSLPADKGVDFAKAAAGFRGTRLSPVGGAVVANTIATGGLEATPQIVAAIIEADGTRRELPGAKPRRVIAADVAREVGEMMVQTCDDGSAARAFRGKDGLPRGVKVAGKTGTLSAPAPFLAAEKPADLEYSWFVGYAPAEAPKFTVSVLLANTDLWWLKAHTAARMVLAEALDDDAR